MKWIGDNPREQRRQLGLLAVLVIVALVVGYTQFGGAATEVTSAASNGVAPVAAGSPGPPGALPEPVRLAALEPVPDQAPGRRNPFGFGQAPPPPAPPAPPSMPVRQAPPPTPRPVVPSGPPPIAVKFLGFAEDPARPGKIVSLGLAGGVVLAREGDVVDGRYRLLKIGAESIVMAYLDGQGQQTIRLSGG